MCIFTGGVRGDETDAAARDLADEANRTILSGDLDGNDGEDFTIVGDNAYHVVISTGDVGTAELNGFTIQGGHANNMDAYSSVNGLWVYGINGGGIYNSLSSPTLSNLIIRDNVVLLNGGGVYNGQSLPALSNVIVRDNVAGRSGGGVFNNQSSITISNGIVQDNRAVENGGGVHNTLSSPSLRNVVITGNEAGQRGGGYFNSPEESSPPILINVTISHNSADLGGAEWINLEGLPVIRNSIIWGNGVDGELYDVQNSLVQDQGGKGNTNYTNAGTNLPTDTNPLFNDPENGDFTLKVSSPAINTGSNSFFAGLDDDTKDVVGNPRVSGAAIDMGAFENPNGGLPVTLVRFDARLQENHVQLTWQTTQEEDFSHFELQRSRDGKNFAGIAEQTPLAGVAGSKNYAYSDYPIGLQGAASLLYYRLKMIDNDGTSAYSNIESVEWKAGYSTARQITLYPNPAQKWLSVSGVTSGDILEVVLLNASGIELLRTGKLSGPIDISGFSNGLYLVNIRFSDGTGEIRKVILDR